MCAGRWWSRLVFHVTCIPQAVVVRRQKRAFHKDLKRLSALGDHLIEDIGLDPQVLCWEKRSKP